MKLTDTIAILFVGSYLMVIVATIAAVLTGMFPMADAIELLKVFSSIVSGFVGIVCGYYFTKEKGAS